MTPWIPRIAGFFIYPLASGIASLFVTPGDDATPQGRQWNSTARALCHAGGGYAAYHYANKTKGHTSEFLQGGMWGEAVDVAWFAGSAALARVSSAPAPTPSPTARVAGFLAGADARRLLGRA